MTESERRLVARLVEAIEDLLGSGVVDDKSNDVIALHSTDPPVVRANEAVEEAKKLLGGGQ